MKKYIYIHTYTHTYICIYIIKYIILINNITFNVCLLIFDTFAPESSFRMYDKY